MKRLVLFLFFAGIGIGASGCATSSVGKFALYGFLDDAEMVVRNSTPVTVIVNIGGDAKDYVLPPRAKLIIPREYPISGRVQVRIPVTATVAPTEPMHGNIRDGGTTWNFSHYGHYLGNYYGGGTNGRYVHVSIELQNPDPKAKRNALVFRIQS